MGSSVNRIFIQIKKIIMILGICTGCLVLAACNGKDAGQESMALQETGKIQNTEMQQKSEDAGGRIENTEAERGTETQKKTAEMNAKKATQQTEEKSGQDHTKDDGKDRTDEKNGAYILARPSKNGALSVNGTQLVDESGQAAQLRGISTHGIAWFPDYVNQDALKQLGSDFGANLFRIAMYTDESGGYCTDGDQEKLKKLVEDGVKYAKAADMYVIVDWHILHDGNPLTHKDQALQFFAEITEKLKDEKHVLYEICNEPNGSTSWADVRSYAKEVIPVIRKNVPDAVVLVGTPTWSQEIEKPQNDPISGYGNIMYTLHFYAATHKDDLRSRMVSAIEAGTPVFVSEFGLCDASGTGDNDLTQAQNWIDIMDQYGISYAVWSLCNKNETSALIASSCQKTSGFTQDDLSESGKWIYDMLHKKGGVTGISPEGSTEDQQKSADSQTTEQSQSQNMTGKDVGQEGLQIDGNSEIQNMSNGDLEVEAKVINSWESDGKKFYQYQLTITNTGTEMITAWEIPLTFSDDITLSDSWNGEYQADGKKLTIHSKDYNGRIDPGESATDVGFIISAAGSLNLQQE